MFSFSRLFGSSENQVSAQEAYDLLQTKGKKALILDVRTEGEYHGGMGHIGGSKLIPLQQLPQRLSKISKYKKQQILVICASGARSASAVRLLQQSGFENARNISGGMTAWLRADLPLK
ncbi:MAG: sulfurtransferase [SAR324 cluster bacterium]|uniref:Sulfurtransferase n=1 Tax=SAR324 cluster bacterium TaxID=2024889 RepID=A0A2A4SRE6_9DELT|nr:MAG: sulfurtransferase [SAR324 cluster bacterium]